MNTLRLSIAALVASALLWGCGGNDNPNPDPDPDPQPSELEVRGEISADTVWATGSTVTLAEHVFVTSGTLKIEPGVTVKGAPGAALVITQNGKIDAQGTADAPITFTSTAAAGAREMGQWAGLVMLGKAPINAAGGTDTAEGFGDTSLVTYGGTDASHDCGALKYVRIQFAGYELSPGNEINSLTLAGCGTGTDVDYVQTHRGSDDGIEVFGGTVNLKHLVLSLNDDDALDWDTGWTGKAQYVVVQTSATHGNFGFEAASNKDNEGATPKSLPEIWNLTMIGSKGDATQKQQALLFKEDTGAKIHRAIVAYFHDGAISVIGSSANEAEASLYVKDSIFFDNAGAGDVATFGDDGNADFDEDAYFQNAAWNNRFVDPGLSAALSETAPNFQPLAGGPAFTSVTGTVPGGFFEANDFVGAVGATDWTAGWTAYPEN